MQVDKTQFDKILAYIEHGKKEGASLLTGGKPCGERGYYIEPTIFTNVTVTTFQDETRWNDLNALNLLHLKYILLSFYFLTLLVSSGQHENCEGGDFWTSHVTDEVQVSLFHSLIFFVSIMSSKKQTQKRLSVSGFV